MSAPDTAVMVAELTRSHTHRERYEVRHGATLLGLSHSTRVPSLIVQLQFASPSSAANGGDLAPSGYGSRPAARLEALDCLQRIDRDSAWWVRHLGADDDRDTAGTVAQLHGLAAGLEACDRARPGCCDAHELEHDIRRWWTQARIVTGWDSPAWRPDNTCPLCNVRGGLRVKLADQAGFCAECGETWTPETIALLADHIRAENLDDDQAEAEGVRAS